MDAAAIHRAVGERIVALGLDPARVADIVMIDDLLGAGGDGRRSTPPATSSSRPPAARAGAARCWRRWPSAGRRSRPRGPDPRRSSTRGTGWPIGFRLVPVPPEAVAEVPAYAGHEWAEPDVDDLRAALRDAAASPEARAARGAAARERAGSFDHRRVAALALERLAAAVPA